MLEEYVYCGTKKMRCGYTTGSCAAAASGAAAEMLISRKIITDFSLITPKGIMINPEIGNQHIYEKSAVCSVVKDGGDDPDITNGIHVFAEVSFAEHGIEIIGGEGVGRITKEGLDQPVGEYAINSVPRKMIVDTVSFVAEKYGYTGGIKVKIFVPNGEEIAKKTYNPHIGIEGGISIIGTSGIVEPMSSRAVIDTIRLEMNMRKKEGHKNLLLTLGNYSESYIQKTMSFALEKSIKCSNFIGDAIDIALEMEFESVLIVGHIGKLVKLGTGIMNTHSSQADGRMDVLVTCGVLGGADLVTLRRITECVTVDAAIDVLKQGNCLEQSMEILKQKVDRYLSAKVKGTMEIGAVMFSDKHEIKICTAFAERLIEKISEEYNG